MWLSLLRSTLKTVNWECCCGRPEVGHFSLCWKNFLASKLVDSLQLCLLDCPQRLQVFFFFFPRIAPDDDLTWWGTKTQTFLPSMTLSPLWANFAMGLTMSLPRLSQSWVWISWFFSSLPTPPVFPLTGGSLKAHPIPILLFLLPFTFLKH